MRSIFLTFCFFLVFSHSYAAAEPTKDLYVPPFGHMGVLSVYFENDFWLLTDRYYTNGAQFTWTSFALQSPLSQDLKKESLSVRLFNFLGAAIQRGLWWNEKKEQPAWYFMMSLGQRMYTPLVLDNLQQQVGDRPFAGWLYVGIGFVTQTDARRHGWYLETGMVGPASLAAEIQSVIHQSRHLAKPVGWVNQLKNEYVFKLNESHTFKLALLESSSHVAIEALPQVGFSLGTVEISLQTGLEIRLGLHIPRDFGTTLIHDLVPSSTPQTQIWSSVPMFKRFGFYFFTRVFIQLVLRDLFLDGNTYDHHLAVPKHLIRDEFAAGGALCFLNSKLVMSFVFQSPHFIAQPLPHQYVSVSLHIGF